MSGMNEVCFCGREGDLSERETVGSAMAPALRCPRCSHVDDLAWLSTAQRRRVWLSAVPAPDSVQESSARAA